MSESLYHRIGGKEAVQAAVNKMYDKILSDPLLIPFFEGIDMDKQRRSQIAFVTMAFGGFNNYDGNNLRDAHADLVKNGLSDDHFDAVAGHLKNAMVELNVPENLMDEAMTIVGSTRNDVLGR